jgi:2-methylisocitrate lyase-like PEP mutase family enzyme
VTTPTIPPSPSAAERRLTLKANIAAPDLSILPGVFDGFSAKLVEAAGYDCGFITGSGVAESRFGVPDVGIIGYAEARDGAAMMAQRTNLALIADGDTGYGNAVNVVYTVRGFEDAGLAGLLIEDQVWPKKCGHMSGKQTIPFDEAVTKVRAAVEARRDPNFVVLARTDALAVGGLDDAVRRLTAFADAGADLVFADAVMSEADIATLAEAVDAPLVVNMGFGIRTRSTTPLLAPSRLQELGAAVAIYPRMLTSAAITGMKNALDVFTGSRNDAVVPDRPDLLVSFEELHTLIGFDEVNALADRYAV